MTSEGVLVEETTKLDLRSLQIQHDALLRDTSKSSSLSLVFSGVNG